MQRFKVQKEMESLYEKKKLAYGGISMIQFV